jgi:hypothetical protein
MPEQKIIITKTKDRFGNDVTECNPHLVVLSMSAGDTIVWHSDKGRHRVEIDSGGRPKPLRIEPWEGPKGQDSANPGQIEAAAQVNMPFLALATLLDDNGNEIAAPGGAVIIIRP